MQAKEFITELLDKPANWSWHIQTNDHAVAHFEVNNINMEVVFLLIPIYDEHGELRFMDVWDVEFKDPEEDNPYGITGKFGSESKTVFATVIDILRNFKQQHKDATLKFTAEEPNRQKLYNRFMRILKQQGFKTKSAQSSDGKMGYLVR